MGRLRSVLPEGSTKCRIRATARETREPVQGTLMDTLGEETEGFVMIDPTCIAPMRFDQLRVLNGIVGKSSVRIVVQDALQNNSWRKVNAAVDGLGEQWCKSFAQGTQQVLHETWVKGNDHHLDAKIFPHLHPYGTGSLSSEIGAGGFNGIPRMCRQRMLSIQSGFRNNSTWTFWNLQRIITGQLFRQELMKRNQGRKHTSSPTDKDALTRLFGTVVPSEILSRRA